VTTIPSQTPVSFRQETLKPFFEYVRSGESFYIVGASSVGKTRLVDFLLGDDPELLRANIEPDREQVKNHYLGQELSARTWLVRVDLNRMGAEYDWGFRFYELLLSALLFETGRLFQTDEIDQIKNILSGLDSAVMESKDPLRAHRLLEMAINQLCQSNRIKLCFLFDEFDETYQNMPREIFAQLRAIRDANKYRLCYGLFMRNLPEKLRSPLENESFYELISRNLIGVGPYSREDSIYILQQWENRRIYPLSPDKREWIYLNSGGHPGMMQALFGIFKEKPLAMTMFSNLDWYVAQETIQEEFRKIWGGLLDDEKLGLLSFVNGNFSATLLPIKKILYAKGLLQPFETSTICFSPLFELYLKSQLANPQGLSHDPPGT